MAEDKQVRKYAENLSYGKDSLSSEIHGKNIQETVNKHVAFGVEMYDKAIAEGNKALASHWSGIIKKWSRDLDDLKAIKEEFFLHYAGGRGGEKTFSNYTDLNWERKFMTENGIVAFDDNMNFIFGVTDEKGETSWKKKEDITENWVAKGTEETDFMALQQSAVEQSNDMDRPLDYDIDWEVSKIISKSDAWKVFTSDKIGGRYMINDWIEENAEAIQSGKIPDEMLHPDSFNPDFDNRLHMYLANRIRKSFDENYQTPAEARKADELIARTKTQETNTENTQV